jgi:ABC-type oligopeptide transport system substrate-binding subunit/DNA-binding SARP family transcriptional activator
VPTLRLCLLGPLDIRWDDQQLPKPPTLKSQSLLAYLILHRDQPQPRDRLVDLFWGDRPEAKARRSLRTALWHIRRGLPDEALILSDRHTVQFDPRADLWLDVDEFEFLAGADDIADLQSAVALYGGDFMDGFYDDWVINERYRLETLFSEALARLMVGQEERGAHDAALATALRVLDQDRLREDAHRSAMRAYCRLGQRNTALEQYRRCQEIVLEELGTEPMVETIELYQEILERRFPAVEVAKAVPIQVPSLEPTPAAGRDPLDVAAPARLIGREQELAFLHRCWQEAEAARGGLVLVSGEAGVGKTRLAEEFAHQLRWQGVRVLWGRCYQFERVLPYQPVAEAMRTVLPSLTPAELAGFPPWARGEVSGQMSDSLAEPGRSAVEERSEGEVTPESPSDEQRTLLFESTARFLGELSSQGALLIVLEDLHWASEPTLQLVHYLARHLAEHQVLIVGTFRSEEVGLEHPVLVLRRRLTRERVARPLRLRRLSSDAVEELVMEMSGAGEAVMPLAKRLYKETEGNPFFLMEIVKALFETGVLHLEGGVWQGDFTRMSEEELPLPAAMSEAIQARAHRLDEDSQEALRLAAVLGREFDFDLLNAVWRRGEENTLKALDDLLRHRLIEEGSGAMGRDYAFAHHKIQEVIYSAVPRRHRQHSHAAVGRAMETLFGASVEDFAGELAFHFLEGAEHDETLTEKAIAYLLQAGDRARTLYAHEEAIDHYQGALALLKEVGDYERAARTLMKLGLTCHTAFDFKAARQAYQEGFVQWQRAGLMEPADPPAPAPHPLRVDWGEPLTLDPAKCEDLYGGGVVEQLFSGLLETSAELGVVPDVARGWELSEGGRKYVFHLRDDVRWSDGMAVTAGDFEYAWKRLLDPGIGSALDACLLYDVKNAKAFREGQVTDPQQVGVRAPDEVTLEVYLERPTSYFPHLLARHPTFAVPRHVVEAHGEAWTEVGIIVTSGPFYLEAWSDVELMVLVRNPEYHGRFSGNVRRVELHFAPPLSAAYLESYEADSLDVVELTDVGPAELDRVRRRHPDEYIVMPKLNTVWLGFDVGRAPFDDVRVRRAFVLATDRESLSDVLWRGTTSPATGGVVPPGMPGHSPRIGLPYDPKQAQSLLAEAGYPGGCGFPLVVFLTPTDPAAVRDGEYLVTQWRENLGVEVSLESVKWSEFMEKLDGLEEEPREIFRLNSVADYPDPDAWLGAASDWRQWSGWRNNTYNRLVEEARRAVDQSERMKLYAQAEGILVEEAPIMPLSYWRCRLLLKPWVRRYPTSPIKDCFWKDVIMEPH